MRAKTLILLVVALGCGMVAAVAVSKAVTSDGPTEEPTVEIFVAAERLPTDTKLTPKNVKLIAWPKKRVPEGAITKLEQLEEKYTKQPIFKEEPLLKDKIGEDSTSIAGTLPEGHRLFEIKNGKNYIKPGDRVDITGLFKIGGSRRGGGTAKVGTVMKNVPVHAINGNTVRDPEDDGKGKSPKDRTFQLLIKESQYEALQLANNLGELDLIVRPRGEQGTEGEIDNGESFLSWVKQNEEEDVEETPAPEPKAKAFTSITTPPDSGKKTHQMRIITPEGVKTFSWSEDGEMPELVQPESASTPPAGAARPNPWPASGNVYSGYGAYQPTYPTSASPQQAGEQASEPVREEAEQSNFN